MKIFGREYESSYDAIIIGSGVGGLICGGLLAQAGMKVLLVERHYVLGGYCSTFRRNKFVFDSATHFYPLLGNPSTLTGKILQKLEIPTRWIKMDPVDKFHFPDGETFEVPADFSVYLDRLKGRFPEQVEQIDRFFAEVREAYLYGLLYYFKDVSNAVAEKFKPYTLEQKLHEHFQDPRLRALLMADTSHWGSLPSRTSFLFDSLLRLSYFLGNYYPEGGSQVFADDLGAAIKQRGGRVLLCGSAERILIEDGRAAGVLVQTVSRTRPERVEFRAPVVISNADVLHTYTDLVGVEHCGREVLDQARKLRPTHACFLVHMGLRGVRREELEKIEGYHWFSWDPNDLERTFFKLFFPTHFEPRMAPPDHQILIVQKMSPVAYDEVQDWQAHKQEIEAQILDDLRRLLPGIDDHIVIKLSATANTSFRYTLNYQGAMLGWEMSPDQLGTDRPSNETPIENLYLVGHWTQPGGGITPVILSAQRVAKLVLSRRDDLPAQTQKPASRGEREKGRESVTSLGAPTEPRP
ncbi:MAG: phytoene desaturase family protein [Acidobacteriota bacterium]